MTLFDTGERLIPSRHKGSLIYYEHIARYKNAIKLCKSKKVLDVASGSGYGTKMISKVAKSVVGLDISNEAVKYSKRKYKGKNIKFIQGSCLEIPFENSVFDVVISFETIEHINNHEKFLEEIKRVIKPKGLVVISTPNKRVYTKKNTFHKKELTSGQFKKLLGGYFKHIQIAFQDSVTIHSILNSSIKTKIHPNKETAIYTIAYATNSSKKMLFNNSSMVLPFNANSMIYEYEHLTNDSKMLKSIYKSRGWKILSFTHSLRLRTPILKNI